MPPSGWRWNQQLGTNEDCAGEDKRRKKKRYGQVLFFMHSASFMLWWCAEGLLPKSFSPTSAGTPKSRAFCLVNRLRNEMFPLAVCMLVCGVAGFSHSGHTLGIFWAYSGHTVDTSLDTLRE